jgi:hypothetical protein
MASSPNSPESVSIIFKVSHSTWRVFCITLVFIVAFVFGARFVFTSNAGTVHTEPVE